MKTSFPELYMYIGVLNNSEICDVEDSPPPPVEVIPDDNSTGLISGIRERLQNESVIEIPETMSGSDCEEANPMDLVSNDSFNRVCFGVVGMSSSNYQFNNVMKV